jgi:hypothetical protein
VAIRQTLDWVDQKSDNCNIRETALEALVFPKTYDQLPIGVQLVFFLEISLPPSVPVGGKVISGKNTNPRDWQDRKWTQLIPIFGTKRRCDVTGRGARRGPHRP